MKPLCRLTDPEVARFGALAPEDLAREGVPEDLVPYVWGVAQILLEARLCRDKHRFHSHRLEAMALGEHASWGNRGNTCSALAYLVRNVGKAVVRENKSARNRPARPNRDFRRALDHESSHPFATLLKDTPYWRVAKNVWPEPGESPDEYFDRYHQECRDIVRYRSKT